MDLGKAATSGGEWREEVELLQDRWGQVPLVCESASYALDGFDFYGVLWGKGCLWGIAKHLGGSSTMARTVVV